MSEWRKVVQECEQILGCSGTASSPLSSNLSNMVRDIVVERDRLRDKMAHLASQVGPCPEDTCEAMRVFGYCEKECHKCARWRGQQAGLAQAALEADAADLWKLTNAIKAAIEARQWIVEGRGPYEWDDARYKEEAGYAFAEVLELIKQVQPPASKRFHEAMTGALEKRLEAEKAKAREEMEVLVPNPCDACPLLDCCDVDGKETVWHHAKDCLDFREWFGEQRGREEMGKEIMEWLGSSYDLRIQIALSEYLEGRGK